MKKNIEMQSGAFLLSAITAWFISGALALVIAAAFLSFIRAQEAVLAYVSSVLSFISAFFAGSYAMRKRKHNALFTALVSAVAIIILALTVAFLIAGSKMEPAGVLSLVSFTITGTLAGAVLLPGKQGGVTKTKFRLRKK